MRIKCPSGVTGEVTRLKKIYENYEEWAAYARTFNLDRRLGFRTPLAAWKDNPLVRLSVNPGDYARVRRRKHGRRA